VPHRALALVVAGFACMAAVACTAPLALAQGPAPTVRGLPTADKIVALTFDDGPSPRYTPKVLAALQAGGAKATFFLIGQEANRYPELVKAEVKAGMEIANHGMHHLTLKGRSADEVKMEASEAADTLFAISGRRPTLYRLPKGVGDTVAYAALGDLGYVVVNWSVDTRDYIRSTPEQLYRRAMAQVAPGRIIIFHDGGGNRQATVDALALLLPALKAQGYRVTTVSDLLRAAGFQRSRRSRIADLPPVSA